ncbi:MAG: DNA polymerase III subunit beta [Candidatus Saccharibacteria bacterium]|nr:DNA polymerase III subunit beta [Candidatus Saccharibacteria bacterium]
MKLTIKQDSLAKALNSVGRIATARAGLPILANILIRTDENKLIIAATNLEVAVITTVSAQVSEQGAIAVPARLLTDFVSNLPHANVELETDEQKLKISAAGFKSTINSMVADDYPALPEAATGNSFVVPAETLKKAIGGTVLVTSNDVTRPILTGVYFYTDNGTAYMAATDGYRLAESKVMDIDQELEAIIPRATLADVARQLGEAKEVTVKYNDSQITFEVGDTAITSLLIDGKFIGYKQLIPTETNFQITVDRTEFIKITKVAELFSRESAGSVIIEGNPVEKTLSVRSITSQLGDNTSSIEADLEVKGAESCVVSLNSKFLLDALNCIEGDKVTMSFNGKLSPVLLVGTKDDYKHIIMPVKS